MSWQYELRKNIRSLKELSKYYDKLKVSSKEAKEIEKAVTQGKIDINIPKRYLEDLIQSISNEKQLKQIKNIVLPKKDKQIKHLITNPITFIEEEYHDNNPVTGLTQMYPDRVLISPNYFCANNCLWCFRKKTSRSLTYEELENIYQYISKNKLISDVILTGGEPLLVTDERLDKILTNLRNIPHVDIIRFHTRILAVLPSRITNNLIRILKKHKSIGKPIYFVTQIVHPNELTTNVIKAINKLSENGIMVLNQAPILKGINDDQETFNELTKKLIKYQVKPYYAIATIINDGENSRFYVPPEKVEELVNNYASRFDGLGRPTVIIPVMGKKYTPERLKKAMKESGYHFRNTKRDI